MAQTPTKKTTPTNARIASDMADKAAKTAFEAAQTTRENAENVVKIGQNTVKEIMSTSVNEAQRAKEKMVEMGREGSAQMNRSMDAASKSMVDVIGIARENMEACMECCSIGANMAKDVSNEITECCNSMMSDMMEISKDAFSCRTVNDVMDLQNRMMQTMMDGMFGQGSKISNMCFEYMNEMFQPLNERMVQSTKQLSRSLAA